MKKYIGRKQVMAKPMSEDVAVEKGFARPNTNNHEWRSGYHVQYANPDGSTYDSWSPKSVFEKAYRIAETFIDRLHIERDELRMRLNKARDFFNSPKFNELTLEEQKVFERQLDLMKDYLDVLHERIRLAETKLNTNNV